MLDQRRGGFETWRIGLSKVAVCSALFVSGMGLGACGKIEDFGMITDQSLLDRSSSFPAYTEDAASAMPRVRATLGPVRFEMCKYRDSPPSVGEQAALAQLRARAAMMSANGVAHLRFASITDRRSPCWRGVDASGLAVVFEPAMTRASLP